jgi:hypothetical protein
VPLTIATASTLYTLQGTTCAPGLIYHFRTPRRISAVTKWIATYMTLSRVQSLGQLRSIGLTTATKDLIDNAPPEEFLTRFLTVFGEKTTQTQRAVQVVVFLLPEARIAGVIPSPPGIPSCFPMIYELESHDLGHLRKPKHMDRRRGEA